MKLPPKPTNSFLNMPLVTPKENKEMQRNQPKRSSKEAYAQAARLRAARQKSLSGQNKKDESSPKLPEPKSSDSQTSNEVGQESRSSLLASMQEEAKEAHNWLKEQTVEM